MLRRIVQNIRSIAAGQEDIEKHANKLFIGLLVFFGICTHLLWFNPGSVLFHSDWLHWTDEAAKQAWQALGTWSTFFGFGEPRIQIGFTLVQSIWSLVGYLGGNFDMGVKVALLWPIAIMGFVAPYLAMRHLYKNDFIAFVSAIFYGSTAYFLLRQGAHLPIAFVYAIAPLIFLLFVKALQTMSIRWWLSFVLLYSVGLCYEIRIMYIFTFVLILYAALFVEIRSLPPLKTARSLVVAGLVFIGLNAFWLLPTALGSAGATIGETTSQELFGSFLFDLQHSISLSPASWTGGVPDESFVKQPVPLYMWLIPVLIFGLLLTLKNPLPERKRLMLFFVVITIAGLFLTKQVEQPLPNAYPWLYGNFPGFSLFREASKFYIYTAFGYMGLLALGLQSIREVNYKFFQVAAALPIAVALVNTVPLVSGNIRSMFVSRSIPNEYVTLNKMIASQPGIFRTMWVPSDPKWGYFDESHPRVSAASVTGANLKPLISPESNYTAQRRITDFFNRPIADKLLDTASVKYIVVPLRDIDNQDDFMRYYGDDRQYYVDLLDAQPWLKKVDIGSQRVAVYENMNIAKHVDYATNLFDIGDATNLDRYYELNQQQLKQEFHFAIKDEKRPQQGRQMLAIFEDLPNLKLQTGGVSTEVNVRTDSTTIADTNVQDVHLRVENSRLDIARVINNGLMIDSKMAVGRKQSTESVYAANLRKDKAYYAVYGNQVTAVDPQKNADRIIAEPDTPVELMSNTSDNLIKNGSLEQGLWQKMVEDCNNYDSESNVYMYLDNTQKTDGRNSLSLPAAKHSACSGPEPVAVQAGKRYMLTFDVRGDESDQIGYLTRFNNPSQTSVKKYIPLEGASWRTINQLVEVPKDADRLSLKLLGMPNTRTRRPTITYYDNIKLQQVDTLATIEIEGPNYQSVPIGSGRHAFGFEDSNYRNTNLFPNASLENGLWKKEVSDCNAYDDKADLKMKDSEVASNGQRSLELSAKRHIACTGPPAVKVRENSYYLLSFDHQSPNAKNASYYVNFIGDNVAQAALSADVPTDPTWQTYTRLIKTPAGAKDLQLSVRSRADEQREAYLTNRYDNFRLVELPSNLQQYYIVGAEGQGFKAPQGISYKAEDPARRAIHITKASGKFYLTLADSYNESWRLVLNNQHVGRLPWSRPDIVSQEAHVRWDGFVNGWLVDPAAICQAQKQGCTANGDGTYDLDLIAEFSSQRWFNVGVATSISALLACLAYFGVLLAKSRAGDSQAIWRVRR